MQRLKAGLALAAAVLFLGSGVAAEPLTVCLDEDAPPLSFSFGPRQGGFDHGVAEEVAKRLGRPLEVQWFESENDEENVPVWEANALLSDGLCDLIGGFPLLASALGKPETEKGAIPEYEGMKRSERGRLVSLGVMTATAPYHRSVFGIIVGPKAEAREVRRLADLQGLRLGAEVGTMSAALLARSGDGMLRANVTHVPESKDLLGRMAAGEFDAVLIELHRFDNFRRRNPEAPVRWSGYAHPLGINMAFGVLERNAALRDRVSAILAEMANDGTLRAIAEKWQMTLVPPREPMVLEHLTPAMLTAG